MHASVILLFIPRIRRTRFSRAYRIGFLLFNRFSPFRIAVLHTQIQNLHDICFKTWENDLPFEK